jgi:hypothetical protein
MKILKVIYDDDTKFILDIVRNLPVKVYLEEYTISDYRQKKKALTIMTRHGTCNVPLVVFEDENLEEYAAVWSESSPDWHAAINIILNV